MALSKCCQIIFERSIKILCINYDLGFPTSDGITLREFIIIYSKGGIVLACPNSLEPSLQLFPFVFSQQPNIDLKHHYVVIPKCVFAIDPHLPKQGIINDLNKIISGSELLLKFRYSGSHLIFNLQQLEKMSQRPIIDIQSEGVNSQVIFSRCIDFMHNNLNLISTGFSTGMSDARDLELRQSNFSDTNVIIQPQSIKQAVLSNKNFENDPTKSVNKLPPLKKSKHESFIDEKSGTMPPNPTLDKKNSEPADRKPPQNAYVIKKFNSKRKISKKKQIIAEFKPETLQRYRQYMGFISLVNISNNIKFNIDVTPQYTLYVGKGNNGTLIKNIFRIWRPWWKVEANDPESEEINIHWYQLRQNAILDQFHSSPEIGESKSQYIISNMEESKNQKNEKQSKKSGRRQEKKETSINMRSQSMIHKDTSNLARTMNYKRSSSKNQNEMPEKCTRLSPIPIKPNFKELKEDVADNEQNKTKKTIINPKMWPVYTIYRKIFSATDMKKLKAMNIFKEDGSINGTLDREKMRTINNKSNAIVMHNHLENNWNLSNKKALFMNMKYYYEAKKMNPFEYIPMTFHIEQIGDKQYEHFIQEYNKRAEQIVQDEKTVKKPQYKSAFRPKRRNAWLVKPGENSNRGMGIEVVQSIEQIKTIIQKENVDHLGRPRTHIIQEYILPFLYQKRKFDIRCYILVTSINGHQKGYWYQDGYIRTASKEFNMKNLSNKMIHLTNDAVQKKCEDYGKYQSGNKISFADFQRYLDAMGSNACQNGQKLKFFQQAYPEMKKLASDAVKAVYTKMNPSKKQYSFEIFGLDFLVDENFKIWLIEANTNPCLQLSSPLLGRLIPSMLENAFKIAIDPIYPPPPLSQIAKLTKKVVLSQNSIENNKFQLIFDEAEEGQELRALLTNVPDIKIYDIEQEEDQYDEDEETREPKEVIETRQKKETAQKKDTSKTKEKKEENEAVETREGIQQEKDVILQKIGGIQMEGSAPI